MAVAYDVNVRLEVPQRPKWRLKQTGKYGKGPVKEEDAEEEEREKVEELPEEAAFKGKHPRKDAMGCWLHQSQESKWKCWHARAAEACETMRKAGRAHVVTKPEKR